MKTDAAAVHRPRSSWDLSRATKRAVRSSPSRHNPGAALRFKLRIGLCKSRDNGCLKAQQRPLTHLERVVPPMAQKRAPPEKTTSEQPVTQTQFHPAYRQIDLPAGVARLRVGPGQASKSWASTSTSRPRFGWRGQSIRQRSAGRVKLAVRPQVQSVLRLHGVERQPNTGRPSSAAVTRAKPLSFDRRGPAIDLDIHPARHAIARACIDHIACASRHSGSGSA